MNTLANLKDMAASLPDEPGVYLMKNSSGRIIYIGKAKSLRHRVRSYLSGEKDIKTRHLITRVADIETFVTQNEEEALLLENNLIKRWRPRYNINLKDGKTYPVIKLTNEEFPRVYRTRRILFDGSRYYGPFPRANQIDLYLHLIDRLFPLRKCRRSKNPRSSPCFYYYIGRCSAPWHGKISREEYMELVERVKMLLSGKTDELLRGLKEKMRQAANAREYEKAARYRDQIGAIEKISAEQKVVDFQQEARDYLGLWSQGSLTSLTILQVRGGKLIGRDRFLLEDYSPEGEMIGNFLAQYYGGREQVPRILYLPPDLKSKHPEAERLPELLEKLIGRRIQVRFPQRGRQAQILKMAADSARERMASARGEPEKRLKMLQETLGMEQLPHRIEAFDIAHLSGEQTVASMVCFLGGQAEKSEYRHYRIDSLQGKIDDFEAMREAVARRYTRVLNEDRPLPDLILIDGGLGQVNAALSILKVLGIEEVPIIGLAKKEEEIFIPGRREALRLPESSEALKILISVRDEAHRFATTFHRQIRDKKVSASILERLKGIGKRRSRVLLEHFGSLDEICRQTPEALSKVIGIGSLRAAELLKELKALK